MSRKLKLDKTVLTGDKVASHDPAWDDLPIWEKIPKIFADLPKEIRDQIPKDGAAEHDHYIYGTPKRYSKEVKKVARQVEPMQTTVHEQKKTENELPIWKRIQMRAKKLPADVIAKMPTDGAAEHDHYIYGTPKRNES